MTWIDDLVPASADSFPTLSLVCSAQVTDAGKLVSLGGVDQSCAGLAYHLLRTPHGTGLVVQFPRGRHEAAVLLGCLVQLMRLARGRTPDAKFTTFSGPVVVVGTDTLVHKRLARIRIANQPTDRALHAGRICSDGRSVDFDGAIHERAADGLLYLNTRVGWPRLRYGLNTGVVIVDRCSFSSANILGRALAWARGHGARNVIVVAEVGDENTIDQVKLTWGEELCVWPWTNDMIADCLATLGTHEHTSILSANGLRSFPQRYDVIRADAADIEDTSTRVRTALNTAAKLKRELPPSLHVARRLFYGLVQLTGQMETYNLHSALDHRTSALSTLKYRLKGEGDPQVGAEWNQYYMTKWNDLRLDLLELYEMLKQDNPKFLGVALAIEWIRRQHRTAPICIRVPSEAAGTALEEDIQELIPEWPIDNESLRWATWSERMEWCTENRFEILTTSPPPARFGLLWSREAIQQVLVLYGFELASVRHRVQHSNDLAIRRLKHCRRQFGLGGLPLLGSESKFREVVEFASDARERPEVDLTVDLDVMFFDSEGPDEQVPSQFGDDVGSASVVPVVLEPDGARWMIRCDAQVEVIKAQKVMYLPLMSLVPGTTVVVPQGDGRDELFARLVTATNQSQDLRAFDVMFTRWRRACLTAYYKAGSWAALGLRMEAAGCQVTSQSPRTWATGDVLGPNDPEDIERIGRLAGDPFVEQQYQRIHAAVRQVRSLHMRLGSLLSAAMAEAVAGGGSNLEKLRELLGGIDPSELLDEFELRVVRALGEPTEVPSHCVRKVIKP